MCVCRSQQLVISFFYQSEFGPKDHCNNCDTIVAYDGMKIICQFMKKHKTHKGVQEQGVLLLSSLMENSNTAQFRQPDGCVEIVELALQQTKDNGKLQEIGRELLDSLS